jgi:ABC-type polysaccharide/polyol phosphate export permease
VIIVFVNFSIDLFVTGATLGRLVQGFNYFLYLAPGTNMLMATTAAFQGGRWIFREKHILRTKAYLTSLPVDRGVFVSARLVAWTLRCLLTALPGTMVICLIYSIPTAFFSAALLTALFSMCVVGISMAMATVTGSVEEYAIARSLTVGYFSFLSTTYYPITSLPWVLQFIVLINPMTWTVGSFRSLASGLQPEPVLLLAAVSIAFATLGSAIYRRSLEE